MRNTMTKVLSNILDCGLFDIEDLFHSENKINVGEIVKKYVAETGKLPNLNTVYREAFFDFASENNLEPGKDIDIDANCSATCIYVREDIDPEIKEKFEELFGMDAEEMAA